MSSQMILVKRLTTTALASVALLISACSEHHAEHYYQGASMGTSWSLKLVEKMESAQFDALIGQIGAELNRVEQLMSTYIKASEVSRFNDARSTEWQAVSPAVVEVVAAAQEVSTLTDGAFDITVAPLVRLWGFSDKKLEHPPEPQQVAQAQQQVGYRHLSFRKDPPALRKNIPLLSIDLSAIAKGYAVDQAVNILQAQGLKNYLLEVGGELRASGHNKRLQVWRIGVEKPVPGWREVMREVQLDGIGIATSGDYRNFIEVNDKRYSHEIDPRTGVPLLYRGGSVTVIAPLTMQADAWATGLFVLGKAKGMAAARQQGLAVYYIEQTDDGFIQTMNKKFSQHLTNEVVQ